MNLAGLPVPCQSFFVKCLCRLRSCKSPQGRPLMSYAIAFVGLACLLAAAPAPEKDNTARPASLPIGVADAAGKVGYVPNDKAGIDAIDLANGDTLWQTKESTQPLLALE